MSSNDTLADSSTAESPPFQGPMTRSRSRKANINTCPQRSTIQGDQPAVNPLSASPPAAVSDTVQAKPTINLRNPFRFLDLPPELRNSIYRFALTKPDNIEISTTSKIVPGLIYTNRQIFDESKYLFLSQNQFVVICKDADFSPLLGFIASLKLKGNSASLNLRKLSIKLFCHGRIFPSKIRDVPFKYPNVEDLDLWRYIIQTLKATGLHSEQVSWLPWLPVKAGETQTLGWQDYGTGEVGAMKEILHDFVLPSLLKEVGFFSKATSPHLAGTYTQVYQDWQVLGLSSNAAVEMNRHLSNYAPQAMTIYAEYQRELVRRRNGLVQKVIDKSWDLQSPVQVVAKSLRKLKRFDEQYGAAVHRNPAKSNRLYALVKAYTTKGSKQAATKGLVVKSDQGMGSADQNVSWDETDEEKKERVDNNAALDKLHKEQDMDWRVEIFAENLTQKF